MKKITKSVIVLIIIAILLVMQLPTMVLASSKEFNYEERLSSKITNDELGSGITTDGSDLYYIREKEYNGSIEYDLVRLSPNGKKGIIEENGIYNLFNKKNSSSTIIWSELIYSNNKIWSIVRCETGSNVESLLVYYDVNKSNNWEKLCEIPSYIPQEGYDFTVYNSNLYIIGGITGEQTEDIEMFYSKKVYMYDSSKKTYKYLGQTSKNTYNVKNLKEAKDYKFKVRAYKTIDKNQKYGSYSSVLKTGTKTATPKIWDLTSGKKKLTVEWGKVSKASGYEVYVATSKNGKYTRKKTIKSGKTTTAKIKGLKSKKKYYVKVRTYRTVDGKKIYSSFSSKENIKVK